MDNELQILSDSYKLLCRACLSPTTTNLVSTFNTKFENSSLYDIYKNCVSVEVEPNDKLPQCICKSCFKKLIGIHEFKKQCQQSDITLKTALQEYGCKDGDKESAVIVVLENDMSEIIEIEAKDDEIFYNVDLEAEQNYKLNSETQCDHISAYAQLNQITTKTKRRIHKCPECAKSFTSSSFKSHLRTHTKEKPYICPHCQMKFSLSSNLKRHIKVHTGEKPHVCEMCGKGFIQTSSLAQHRRTHTGETPHMCCYCGLQFTQYKKYQIHLAEHEMSSTEFESLSHKCTTCDSVFLTKALLNRHMLIHGEKSFLCSYCGKGFVTNAALSSHLKVHTGDKPYTCTECNKSYKHFLSLKSHKLTHTGEKPFSCQLCLKNFTQVNHLKAHMKIHTGEKSHQCSFCNKAFALKGNLTVHERTHTGETSHKCEVCNKGFYDSSNLKKHKKQHNVVEIL